MLRVVPPPAPPATIPLVFVATSLRAIADDVRSGVALEVAARQIEGLAEEVMRHAETEQL